MDDVAGKVERWLEAGVVDTATADRILEFERTAEPSEEGPSGDRPGPIEAFLYLGVIVLGIGVFSFAASSWEDLESWARALVIGVPAVLSVLIGILLRMIPDAAVGRGGQMAWFVSVALVAGLALVLGEEYGPGVEDPGPRLTAGVVALVFAAVLWAAWPTHLQVLALAGAGAFFAQMIGSWPDEFDQRLAALVLIALSTAALVLTELGSVTPTLSARLAFALTLVAGGLEMQIDSAWYWEPWALVAGAGLVALSIYRGFFGYMAVGMGGIFVGLTLAVGEHLQGQLGTQLAFALSGVIIIAGAALVAQFRRALHWGHE